MKGLDLDCLDCLTGKYKISGNDSLVFLSLHFYLFLCLSGRNNRQAFLFLTIVFNPEKINEEILEE